MISRYPVQRRVWQQQKTGINHKLGQNKMQPINRQLCSDPLHITSTLSCYCCLQLLYKYIQNKNRFKLSRILSYVPSYWIAYAYLEKIWTYSQLCLSRIRISCIIAYVKGQFKFSFLYHLLFLTPHKSNFWIFSKSKLFLQCQWIQLRQSWLYYVLYLTDITSN